MEFWYVCLAYYKVMKEHFLGVVLLKKSYKGPKMSNLIKIHRQFWDKTGRRKEKIEKKLTRMFPADASSAKQP
jgi:hypothetical protein